MVRIGGKGMSYIVKNCPAILRMTKICDAYETTQDLPQFCKDRTNCVIKQVIEKCKTIIEKDYREEDRYLFSEDDLKILDRISFDVGLVSKKVAKQILQLFDIEEINK
jgi:hypothetical protein